MIPKTTPDLTEENNKPLIFDIGIQPCTTAFCDAIHDWRREFGKVRAKANWSKYQLIYDTSATKYYDDRVSEATDNINTGHLTQIDLLKGLAIISVILLHTWPEKVLLITGAPFHIWQAVPVFILIAGYVGTLSYKRRDTARLRQCYGRSLLSHRFKRILVPFTLLFII